MIKKLAMQTNGKKIQSTINQSYCIIRTFDLCQTLPNYLRTFLHKNALFTIGLTDQSGYSICLLYGQTFHPYSSTDALPYAIQFVSRNERADFFIKFIKLNRENIGDRYFLPQSFYAELCNMLPIIVDAFIRAVISQKCSRI